MTNNRFQKRSFCFLSFYLIICGLGIAVAKADSADELLNLSLQDLLKVKVTASTRTEESLRSVPSAVTVLEQSQFQRMGVEYLHELLDFVPGFQSQRAGDVSTMYSTSSRGRRNGSQSKELLLVIDDRVFNEPRNGSANGARFLIPLSLIEKVEVIRGPGSAVYGSNAYTGVIKLTTVKKDKSMKIEAGSFSKKSVDLRWHSDLGDWESNLLLSVAEDEGDSYLLANNSNAPTQSVATIDPYERLDFDFSISNKNSEIRIANIQNRTNNFYVVETARNDVNRVDTDYLHLFASHKLDWSSKFTTQFSIGYLQGDYQLDLQLVPEGGLVDISSPSSTEPLIGLVKLDGETTIFNIYNKWKYDSEVNLQFGLEVRKDDEVKARAFNNYDLRQLAEGNLPIDYYDDFERFTFVGTEEDRDSKSAYVQYLRNVENYFRLTMGVRYDDYSDAGSYTSPRVGITRAISDGSTVKLLYGEAFRAPALNETQLINNSVIIGNPDLIHETVKTWDLIWHWESESSSFIASLHHNKFEDPIETSLENNIREFVNGPSSFSKGIEIEASQQLSDNWYLRETFSYFWELPESSFRESDRLASIFVNYHKENWNWNLSVVYHGEKQSPAGQSLINLDERVLLNSKLIYQLNKNTEIQFVVKNLLDETYYDAASGNTLAEGLPNRGREFFASIIFEY